MTASESEVRALGEEILRLMGNESPSIFKRDYWQGQVMEWSMNMPAFKVEMFRFVDVLPVLTDSTEVARHIQEYFCRPEQDFPKALQWGLKTLSPGSMMAKIAAGRIEKNVVSMGRSFIAGTDAKDAMPALKKTWKRGVAFTVDLLGEATVSETEAADYERRYLDLIENLARECAGWKAQPQLESDAFGPIPRVNVSIKLSSLDSQIDPLSHDASVKRLADRLRPLFARARDLGVFLNLDMEHYALKSLTLDAFMALMSEDQFAGYNAGCVIQAYLRDADDDLDRLIAWCRASGQTVTVRLVKGAYWDQETIEAEQHGWPVPVWTDKAATDACYERLTLKLLDNIDVARPAFASHNVRSLAFAVAEARARGISDQAYEFQMLFGMAEPLKAAVRKMGFRLREYVPVGELIPGMAYLVRRLLENTSNESWLRLKHADGVSLDALLAAPVGAQEQVTPTGYPAAGRPRTEPGGEGPWVNEALHDFAHAPERAAFYRELAAIEGGLGWRCPLVVNGQERFSDRVIESVNPAAPQQIVATSAVASTQDATDAVEAAVAAFPAWRDRGPEARVQIMLNAAERMRAEKDRLAAIMVLEAGKSWPEADGDVCEAIDFLEFYAREMRRLAPTQNIGRIPGELNQYRYQPRGVAVVISPWNFPLAILTGMTAAALVAGNCAIVKPAEQTPAIAAEMVRILRAAGVPDGALHFLPGYGEEVGAFLVEHPRVDLIAFTGSKDVGVGIMQAAAVLRPGQRSLKKVIAELGGKNAVIVDSDADLDMAVMGTLRSAFGFQGQKCSACSRAIVLQHNHDVFVERLVEAVRSLRIGPPSDPSHVVGPVIDDEAKRRIERYIEAGRAQSTLAISREVPTEGFYVGPTVFTGVEAHHTIAQEEIFGPVLGVIKVQDFDEAMEVAMSTPFALTGGLFSRSPLNIARAREEFRVGNLYINRKITGALVNRQPFGGGGLSGVGGKAGGPDYLLNFMEARTVTENTMRRGFAPED